MARRLGILVAGGEGARLAAGVPKALAILRGETLLARALRLAHAVCDDVVVCAPGEMALPVPAESRVDDPADAGGPLAGLVAGLASRPFDVALALGVDFPLLDSRMLLRVLAALGPHAAALPAPGGVPQPLAAWYAPAAVAPLAAALALGERSLTRAVLGLSHALVGDDEIAAVPGGLERFLNVNTPGDLLAAGQFLERQVSR